MKKWLQFTSLCCVLAVVAGCGGSRELPPVKEAPKVESNTKEAAAKGMQGMPPDIQKQYQEKMKRMKR